MGLGVSSCCRHARPRCARAHFARGGWRVEILIRLIKPRLREDTLPVTDVVSEGL